MSAYKNLQMVVMVLLLIMAAASSLFQEKVHMPQTFELRIDSPDAGASRFTALTDVDTNTEELQQYSKNVDSFSLRGITYAVQDVRGSSDAMISGTIEFAPAGSSTYTVLGTISDLHLKKMGESGQANAILLPDNATRQKLARLLQQGSLISFRLNATSTASPIAASLVVTLNKQMTVEL